MGLSQVALVACAAGSCVMITTVSSARKPATIRKIAIAQYSVAGVIAVVSLVAFFSAEQQPEMSPEEYLRRNLASGGNSLPWLLPLLYVLLALTLVSWAGLRHSNRSRRGRALFVFTIGIVLIVLASGFFFLRAVGNDRTGRGRAPRPHCSAARCWWSPRARCCPASRTGSVRVASCGPSSRCSTNSAAAIRTSASGCVPADRWCSGWPSGCR